jgi:hypothetical protein
VSEYHVWYAEMVAVAEGPVLFNVRLCDFDFAALCHVAAGQGGTATVQYSMLGYSGCQMAV